MSIGCRPLEMPALAWKSVEKPQSLPALYQTKSQNAGIMLTSVGWLAAKTETVGTDSTFRAIITCIGTTWVIVLYELWLAYKWSILHLGRLSITNSPFHVLELSGSKAIAWTNVPELWLHLTADPISLRDQQKPQTTYSDKNIKRDKLEIYDIEKYLH